MSLYVSFLIKSNKKWSLEGSYERSKIWREKAYFGYSRRHQVHNHMNVQTSAPPSPHVATPVKVSTAISKNYVHWVYFWEGSREAVMREGPRERVSAGQGYVADWKPILTTLSYSSKINGYLYWQRVSPPLKKKRPDMLSETMLPIQSGVTALCR